MRPDFGESARVVTGGGNPHALITIVVWPFLIRHERQARIVATGLQEEPRADQPAFLGVFSPSMHDAVIARVRRYIFGIGAAPCPERTVKGARVIAFSGFSPAFPAGLAVLEAFKEMH